MAYTKDNRTDTDQGKEVIDVLLRLLRRADDQVKATQDLTGDALRAVEEYKAISASLAVKQFNEAPTGTPQTVKAEAQGEK